MRQHIELSLGIKLSIRTVGICSSISSERKPVMAYEECLAHVLDDVLARDLPDELLGQALADEAELHSRRRDDITWARN